MSVSRSAIKKEPVARSTMELQPFYVDVIINRWQDFTGAMPVLESSGEPYDFTQAK